MKEHVKLSPTLIIGLGGTGSLAVQYVKRKIRERLDAYKTSGLPLPRTVPFIEYLVLDTTPQEEVLDGWFVPDEYLNIGRVNVSRVISSLDHDLDYNVQKWFPKELDPGQIDSRRRSASHGPAVLFHKSISNRKLSSSENQCNYRLRRDWQISQ